MKPVTSFQHRGLKPGHLELQKAYGKAVKQPQSYGPLMLTDILFELCKQTDDHWLVPIATHGMLMTAACMRL